jgi:hypothetical protein
LGLPLAGEGALGFDELKLKAALEAVVASGWRRPQRLLPL